MSHSLFLHPLPSTIQVARFLPIVAHRGLRRFARDLHAVLPRSVRSRRAGGDYWSRGQQGTVQGTSKGTIQAAWTHRSARASEPFGRLGSFGFFGFFGSFGSFGNFGLFGLFGTFGGF